MSLIEYTMAVEGKGYCILKVTFAEKKGNK